MGTRGDTRPWKEESSFMGTRGDTWARGEKRGWLGAGAGPRASRAARACACRPQRRGRGDASASDLHEKGDARQGCGRHVRVM